MAYAAQKLQFLSIITVILLTYCNANDILGCGGFVESHVKLDFSEIEIGLYTKEGSLKEKTECAPTNGYYFLPLYEKGEYVLKIHPPAGLSFEPSEVALSVDGVTDKCSTGQDINFVFNGFGINGRVITLGQKQGPSGIAVQLVNDKGETRNTVTTVGGDFHFTAVIPGKYTVKASHPRWKLEPSQAVVEMKEGKMSLPQGVQLAVKGYEVQGSITSFGGPIQGVYVLLYSKEEKPLYRVEGCNTALLQGVPDSPICHVTTDTGGEFTFGLVPAGEYRLEVLPTSPGQVDVTYNIKPDAVPFTVRHDSLYIKNAFEVTGFTVVGRAEGGGGAGLAGARVLLDGTPVGTSDAAGKFTLQHLQPGTYVVSFQHEKCEMEDTRVQVTPAGPAGRVVGRVARWRVCGEVKGAGPARSVLLEPDRGGATQHIHIQDNGEWCTYVSPGMYTARVEVSQQEQREGLQFYPVSRAVSVGHGPVEGVKFSQLKGTLSGTVQCADKCAAVQVTLQHLAPDGSYLGTPTHTSLHEGKYSFTEVLPGSVEVSVTSPALCWAESRHVVALTQAEATVPPFRHSGYLIHLHLTHAVEVEWSGAGTSGTWAVPAGASSVCVPRAGHYTLRPRGCHVFQPPTASVDAPHDETNRVYFVGVGHAAVVRVESPAAAEDVVLIVDRARGTDRVGPLPYAREGGVFLYTHTLYLAEGEIAAVSGTSQSLVFSPSGGAQVVGGAACAPAALTLRATPALTLAGTIVPPVSHVTVTLLSEDTVVATQTSTDGTYRFGPLDASRAYRVHCEKESYVFSAGERAGEFRATKLAEIHVLLVDDADDTPLQGALVSVSGGSYRRSALHTDTALRFTSLAPGEYYIKPNMKEYKFTPPHHLLTVLEGNTHTTTMRGVRVAWSCWGVLVSLGGAGWGGAVLAALPTAGPHHCAVEEATTEPSGAFRIRGLVPGCEYRLMLKESAAPELASLTLATGPHTIQIVDSKDISGVTLIGVQRTAVTDVHVLVRAHPDLYRTLRVTLAGAHAAPLYSARVQPASTAHPGVMYVLPRLPADNSTYTVSLESTLSRATHTYTDLTHTFISDGNFKHFTFEFAPKVKSSEQELRQSSFLLLPLLGVVGLLYACRERLAALVPRGAAPRGAAPRPARPDLLDKASIQHILTTVNATGKKTPKPKKIQ